MKHLHLDKLLYCLRGITLGMEDYYIANIFNKTCYIYIHIYMLSMLWLHDR